MSKFDDLVIKFQRFSAAQNEYEARAETGATSLCAGLGEFGAFPANAVRLCSIRVGAEGADRFEHCSPQTAALSYDAGEWHFGLEVKFESGVNTLSIFFEIKMRLEPTRYIFANISDKNSPTIPCDFESGKDGMAPFFTYILDYINKVLSTNPYDKREAFPIGFRGSHD